MKYNILAYILLYTIFGNSQIASKLIAGQSTPAAHPKNIMWVDNDNFHTIWVSDIDSLVPYLLHIPYIHIDGTPTLAPVATTGSYNDLTDKPTIPSALIFTTSAATRSFNSAFQVSTTKDAIVSYTIQIACALTLSGGQSGTVYLETSPDNSTWTEVGRAVNTNTGSLTIGLNITNTNAMVLAGFVTKNYYVRLRSTGTGTITYISGQETTF